VFEQARRDVETADRHVQAVLRRDQFEELRPALAAAYDRGVYVQVALFVPSEEAEPDPGDVTGVCTELRRLTFPRPFLVLTDRRRVSFSPKGRSAEEYGVIVDGRTTPFVFHWFFLVACWEVYEPIHEDSRESLPFTLVEITDAVRHLEGLVRDDATVHVRIEGTSVLTGRPRTLSGTVVGVDYVGRTGEGGAVPPLHQLAARATIVLETDEGTFTVGGDGATVEDVSAERIVLERIER